MAEPSSETTSKTSKIAGWVKAALTSLAGLVGGAALMYVSPLVDKVIKPAKPIANFQYEAQGLKVSFQNLSTGGHEGWWDFGDGSALVAFAPDQPTLTHTYLKAGTYNVKLSLKNLLNDENDRTVTVAVDSQTASKPVIDVFEMVPVGDDYAPATFRAISTVKEANLGIWILSDRPVEVSQESANGKQERFFTFKEPGTFTVKLAATNGKQTVERVETVAVKKPPVGMVTANVAVTYEAVFVESKQTQPVVQYRFPDIGSKFSTDFSPDIGFDFVKADLASKDPNFKSISVQVSPDKKKLTISGELVKPAAKYSSVSVPLVVTQQRASTPQTKPAEPMVVNLKVPGTSMVPLPVLANGWVATKRKITLSLTQDGKKVDWKEGELPHNAGVQMSSSGLFVVTAEEVGGQLRIDLGEIKSAWSAWGN